MNPVEAKMEPEDRLEMTSPDTGRGLAYVPEIACEKRIGFLGPEGNSYAP